MTVGLLLSRAYFRQTVLRARSIAVLLLVGLDLLLVVVARSESSDLVGAFRSLTANMLFGFVIPLVSVLWGIAVVRDEVESGTLTYLLMRPIPRHVFYASRLGSALLTSLVLTLGLVMAHRAILGGAAVPAGPLLGAAALGAVAWTAIFALIGATFKRPFMVSVLLLLAFDLPISKVPVAQHVTLSANLVNLAGLRDPIDPLAQLGIHPLTPGTSLLIALLVAVFAVSVGAAVFGRREYTGEEEAR